jgi:hypothetical protein
VLGFSSSGPLSCCRSRPRRPPSWLSCFRCRLRVPVVAMTGPLAPAIPPASSGSQGRGGAGAGAGLLTLVVLVPSFSLLLLLVLLLLLLLLLSCRSRRRCLALLLLLSLPSPSSFVVVPAVSTRNPPCEQLLAAAGAGAGSWSCVPGCWCWCRVPRPLRRGQAAPVIHPTSSCSLAWGRVPGCQCDMAGTGGWGCVPGGSSLGAAPAVPRRSRSPRSPSLSSAISTLSGIGCQWFRPSLGVFEHLFPIAGVVVIPPTAHPTSSCS